MSGEERMRWREGASVAWRGVRKRGAEVSEGDRSEGRGTKGAKDAVGAW